MHAVQDQKSGQSRRIVKRSAWHESGSHAHVENLPLLLDVGRFAGSNVGKQPLLTADDEPRGKLQALRRVEGHQRDQSWPQHHSEQTFRLPATDSDAILSSSDGGAQQ